MTYTKRSLMTGYCHDCGINPRTGETIHCEKCEKQIQDALEKLNGGKA